MTNPKCPYCNRPLELVTKTKRAQITFFNIKLAETNQFYSCKNDNVHWPRSAVISVHTARTGRRPPK